MTISERLRRKERNSAAMRAVKIAHLVSTFGVGLFAGLLYTFAQGVLPTLNRLDGATYTIVEQGLITNLDAFPTGVITIATIAMLLPLYPLIRLWPLRRSSFWRLTLIAWLLFFFGVGLFTILLNVPINNYVKTWNAASPPADWEQARATWGMLNSIRTPMNLLSFALLVWASFDLHHLDPNSDTMRRHQ
jgi:uncharacterized membrane protein